jgi:hypothetical protein
MSKKFDPYFEWLKIPPSEQPPNHYRLLSTARFEADPEIIENAVNRLVARLQNLSNGPRVDEAQRLLNDVAKARLCLSDPKRKAEYDEKLRRHLELKKKQTKAVAERLKQTKQPLSASSSTKTSKKFRGKTRPKNSTGLIIGYAAAVLVIAFGAVAVLYQQFVRSDSHSVALGTRTESLDVPVIRDSMEISDTPQPPDVNVDKAIGDELDLADDTPPTNDPTDSAGAMEANPLAIDTGSNKTQSLTLPNPPVTAARRTATAPHPLPKTAHDPVLRPAELERGESLLGEFVEFEGWVVMANESRSGKTRYLRFSQDWDDSIMIFMLTRQIGETLPLAELKEMTGRKVRASGVVEREFGTRRIGVKIKSRDQLEVVEQ